MVRSGNGLCRLAGSKQASPYPRTMNRDAMDGFESARRSRFTPGFQFGDHDFTDASTVNGVVISEQLKNFCCFLQRSKN